MSDRVLLLVRHAKAVADAPTDAQRPLAGRGHADASAAGRWLADLGVVIDLAVVSPATRAQETWAEIAAAAPAGRVQTDERIYDNSVADLLAVVADVSDDVETLALVGHNPSMHALAIAVDNGTGGDRDTRDAMREGYPTCGIAVFDVAGGWADLGPESGRLRTFAAPRG